MVHDLTIDQQELEAFMSEISEKSFCAGWMAGLEFALWRIMNGGDRTYGFHDVTQAEIDQLWALARKCGCWIIFDDETEETAIDLESWTIMFEQRGRF